MSKAEQRNVTLVRGLGLVAAVSIIIGNVIGTGVFLKARVMTCNVGTPGMVVTVWVVAGFLSLAGALAYAEILGVMSRAGGGDVFLRETDGSGGGVFFWGGANFFLHKGAQGAGVAAP